MIILRKGISAEAKVGGYPVTFHRFEVVQEGGELFRIDVGVLSGANRKKKIFTISSEGTVVKTGTGYLEIEDIFRIAHGLIDGSERVGEIKIIGGLS